LFNVMITKKEGAWWGVATKNGVLTVSRSRDVSRSDFKLRSLATDFDVESSLYRGVKLKLIGFFTKYSDA
jgi:hypothetical protein